jgi:hypothetical protein
MARERRLFSEEFKREAVKLVNQHGATHLGMRTGLSYELTLGKVFPIRTARL